MFVSIQRPIGGVEGVSAATQIDVAGLPRTGTRCTVARIAFWFAQRQILANAGFSTPVMVS